MDSYSEIIAFAHEHHNEDPLRLLLQQQHYPTVNLSLVAQQLEGQRQASVKWPTLASCDDYFYPPKLNREQSSSEATACYKAQLFLSLGGGTLADLTGGMGIDSYFMALQASHVDYFELNPDLFPIAKHNFQALRQDNISCRQGDSIVLLQAGNEHYDMILIDPARRDIKGRKVSAFEDCTPNLLTHLDLLLSRCRYLLVKASPMIDIHQALRQLPQTTQIHIVALNNECKEILFLLSSHTEEHPLCPTIRCLNLHNGNPSSFQFQQHEEAEAVPTFTNSIHQYLYEPHAALMKGGCFNLISQHFNLNKLARNTHLYTSPLLLTDFPGRIFQVLDEIPLNAKKAATLLPDQKVHIISRNHPLTPDQLYKKLKLSEGGTLFLIATTLSSTPRLWLCRLLAAQ